MSRAGPDIIYANQLISVDRKDIYRENSTTDQQSYDGKTEKSHWQFDCPERHTFLIQAGHFVLLGIIVPAMDMDNMLIQLNTAKSVKYINTEIERSKKRRLVDAIFGLKLLKMNLSLLITSILNKMSSIPLNSSQILRSRNFFVRIVSSQIPSVSHFSGVTFPELKEQNGCRNVK